MKIFIVIVLLFNLSVNLLSQETGKLFDETDESIFYYDKIEKDINVSLRFIFPVSKSFLFSRSQRNSFFGLVDGSAGVGYGVIPGYYYIGIAGDIAIGFDWFELFSESKEDKDKNKDKDKNREYSQIGFSFGGRIYNLIKIYDFRIMPFFGCDFLFVMLPMPYTGIEVSFKIVGLEYAYYLSVDSDNPIKHQMSLKIHLPRE